MRGDILDKCLEDYDPVEDFDSSRMHSMEMLVDGTAPHLWTHAHRYVPSDIGSFETARQPRPSRAKDCKNISFRKTLSLVAICVQDLTTK